MTPHPRTHPSIAGHGSIFAVALAAILGLIALRTAADPGSPETSAGVLVSRAWLDQQTTTRLVDARDEETAQALPIPGSQRVEIDPATATEGVAAVQAALGQQGLDGSETLVLVGRSTDLEAVAWRYWLLRWAGVARVHVLDEPLGDDLSDLATGPGESARAPTARTFSAPALGHLTVDATEVDGLYGTRDVEILDLRDGIDWSSKLHGYRAPPRFASGHVPHALPYAPDDLLPTEGAWPEVGRARHVLSRFGPRPINQVRLGARFVLYGDDGADPRATLTFLALERIGVEATVFHGGWRAWSTSPNRPVVTIPTPEAMAARLEDENPALASDHTPSHLVLFDNRGEGAYRSGHLPGAVHLESSVFEARFESLLATHWPGLDRGETPIAFYCYGRDCVRSRIAATDAARAGFRRLLWLRSGFPGWREAGLRFYGTSAETSAPSPH